MSKLYATQCPVCHSRFQVNLEQLSKAQGLVRCGSCMKVFAADQHLETQPSQAPSPAADEEQIPAPETSAHYRDTQQAAPQTQAEADDLDIPHVPLDLQTQAVPRRAPNVAFIGWGLLSLLAILALGLQVLWFERDQLAKHPQLKGLYQSACQHIHCHFKPRQDLPSLKALNLVVRDHPKYLDALSVDLLMENTAPFTQPFPAIRLVFSDLNGEPRAARVFQPKEYLWGDLKTAKVMPSNQAIRINLEILSPGVMARNYHLDFVTPRS